MSNVVPFARVRVAPQAPQAPQLPQPEPRPPVAARPGERVWLALFIVVSLAAHAAALWALQSEPMPLASIGEEVISLEIVVGATAPAGVAQTTGEQQIQAAAPEPPKPELPRETEQAATTQPQQVAVAPEDKALEEKKPEQTEAPPQPKLVEAPKPQGETPRDPEVALLPTPEAKPPAEKPPEQKPAKPVHNTAPAMQPRRIDAPTKEHAQKHAKATPSTAASNVGLGRSDRDTNYAGFVSAHLRRHQQYPADARSRREQGTATVSFSLDGGGRVISARLAKGSGIASLDQEVQAMVRRASPFPAPPSGRSVSFTVPVTFRLN
jgi:protein TonB